MGLFSHKKKTDTANIDEWDFSGLDGLNLNGGLDSFAKQEKFFNLYDILSSSEMEVVKDALRTTSNGYKNHLDRLTEDELLSLTGVFSSISKEAVDKAERRNKITERESMIVQIYRKLIDAYKASLNNYNLLFK